MRDEEEEEEGEIVEEARKWAGVSSCGVAALGLEEGSGDERAA